ncbi:hypothetical protein N9483_07785 [Flavobacteriaceae bacterium]|nr:hypothetical protein [Flavobacteriaceae bacterium]
MMKNIFFLGIFLHSIYSFCQYTGTNQTINNGNMRFGDGVELSINTSGNLKQPFYFNIESNWRQLTYTEPTPRVPYALDSKFGAGGDGKDTWNTTGDLQTNPIMAGQDFDSSGFSGGSGVIKVKGNITVGTAQLELINSYNISSGDNFVEITTTAKNIGAAAITNLRYWIGTRDDYVGGTDSPTIFRGNLVSGAFQQLTLTTERSSALRITNLEEGVLFFTLASNANNSHDRYNNMVNPSENKDPDTALISNTIDGSYSMYVRMSDLAVNESDSFTWYYAAAALDELDDVIGDVAVASCPTCIPDTDRDGILDPLDSCPYAAGVASLSGCPWSLYIGNNYKTTTVSNSIEIANEAYLCSLSNSNYYNIAYHSGASAEPVVGDFIIYNNNYSFSHSLLFETNGFAFMKLRDYNKIVEVQKSDGKIVAVYNCL